MANLIQSIGYSLGKLHTGMLAYFCDLYRDGVREPLEQLFGTLGVLTPVSPRAKREWNSVDLAIFDGERTSPALLIEMKVDDHDHKTTKRIDGNKATGFQTEVYARAFPDCKAYLYITLGIGEYYDAPFGSQFRWVRLGEFAHALEEVKSSDRAIADWKAAIRFEADLRERVRSGKRSGLTDFRPAGPAGWNICFLGQLKEELESISPDEIGKSDWTCYTYGTLPDTILNFGWWNEPRYLEINNNGLLNFKVTLADLSAEAAADLVGDSLRWLRSSYVEGAYKIRDGGRTGASKTLASFDVGLEVSGGLFRFARDRAHIIQRLQEILRTFYGESL